MRHSKLQNELKLILLLADNMGYTATELSEKMEVSRRHIYYLLEFIESAGFILFKRNNKYHLDRRSPFFTELTETAPFITFCSWRAMGRKLLISYEQN